MEPVKDLVVFNPPEVPDRKMPIGSETILHLMQQKVKEHFVCFPDGWRCKACGCQLNLESNVILLKHAATHEKEAEHAESN